MGNQPGHARHWRNKIVGHGEEAPDNLLANPDNFRVHPRAQWEALLATIDEVGFIRSVTVNVTTGHMIDGHLRALAAAAGDEPIVPVEYVQLTLAEERIALATLDPLAALATTDREKLDTLIRSAETVNPTVMRELERLAAAAGIVPGQPVDHQPLFPGGRVAPAAPAALEPSLERDGAGETNSDGRRVRYAVLVVCASAADQEETYDALNAEGYTVKRLA